MRIHTAIKRMTRYRTFGAEEAWGFRLLLRNCNLYFHDDNLRFQTMQRKQTRYSWFRFNILSLLKIVCLFNYLILFESLVRNSFFDHIRSLIISYFFNRLNTNLFPWLIAFILFRSLCIVYCYLRSHNPLLCDVF